MTTLVVVKKNGRAALAADTLARFGGTLESAEYIANADKLISVGDAHLAPAGPASAQLVLRSYFDDPEHRVDFSGLQQIFETFREMQSALKESYHLNPKEDENDPFDSLQMEILLASPAGIFGVYPLRSVQEYTKFYAFGSGAPYALGALEALYDRFESAEELARRAVAAAAKFDDSSEVPVTVRGVELA